MCDSNLKYLCVALMFVLALSIGGQVFAADVQIGWDKVRGAESYEIDYATCDGTLTWGGAQNAGDGGGDILKGLYTYTGAPENAIVLFRTTAIAGEKRSTRLWAGAWFYELLRPINAPGGTGIP